MGALGYMPEDERRVLEAAFTGLAAAAQRHGWAEVLGDAWRALERLAGAGRPGGGSAGAGDREGPAHT